MNSRIHSLVADEPAVSAVRRANCFDWCVGSRSAPGEAICGDLPVVVTWDGGALVGVIDGLGHGVEAARAAERAALLLHAEARRPLNELVQECHRAIRDTRGVVMTLISFHEDEGTATALGVGNVEALIFRSAADPGRRRESILLRGGVVGYQLPALPVAELTFTEGDRLVLATDGVRPDFGEFISCAEPLPQMVERILARCYRGSDDGLVLACCYKGPA